MLGLIKATQVWPKKEKYVFSSDALFGAVVSKKKNEM
jgi:hypothetical protein